MINRNPTPLQIMGDCAAVATVLLILCAVFAGVALHGLAGAIEAFGDGMRWLFG